MSIHSQLSPEAAEELQKQKRNSTVASLLIAFLTMALIAALLAFILITIPSQQIETIVSYVPPQVEEEAEVVTPEITTNITKMPTPPASAATVTNVITSTSMSSISIPDTDVSTNVESLDFGQSEDFGAINSFNFDENLEQDMEEGMTSFFGAKVSGRRICYVIDYSNSMGGIRVKLMKEELMKSIKKLKGGNADYSLIFFAGPVWQSGDIVESIDDHKDATITSKETGEMYQWIAEKHSQDWKTDGEVQQFTWRKPTAKSVRASLKEIEDTPLVYGTRWDRPLTMAYELDPKPDVIIFMTDGSTGKDQERFAEDFARDAKRKKIVINAIALMQPEAAQGMIGLAEGTGGSATMVKSEGDVINLITGEPVEVD